MWDFEDFVADPVISGFYKIISLINEINNYQDSTNTLSNQFTNLLTSQMLLNFLDQSVTVRPSEQQINRGTIVETISALVEDNCAICQDAMERGAQVRKINYCGHIFHKECIDAWFDRNVHCPTCRHDIRDISSSSNSSQGSQSSNRSQRHPSSGQPRRGNTYDRTAEV